MTARTKITASNEESALTAKQQRFVQAYLANGGKQGEAAREAGYASGSIDSEGSRLVRLPHIQQAIHRETLKVLGLHAVPALYRIKTLVDSAKSDYVKLEAARDLLDRAGFSAQAKQDHRLDASLTVNLDLGPSKTLRLTTHDLPDEQNVSQKPALIRGYEDFIEVDVKKILPEEGKKERAETDRES